MECIPLLRKVISFLIVQHVDMGFGKDYTEEEKPGPYISLTRQPDMLDCHLQLEKA